VLQQLSEQVRECHRRAADAQRKADETADPALKTSYSELADRWLFLARSFMFTESLQDFVNQGAQRKERAPVDPKLPVVGQLFDLLPVAIYVCDPSGLIIYYIVTPPNFGAGLPNLMTLRIVSAARTACTTSTVAQ
jgi:hypothetical protein